MNERPISGVIQNLDDKADKVYRMSSVMEKESSTPKDYGKGYVMTEVEAHTLSYVASLPQATVTYLAEYAHRTKGTISKVLKKLEEKGLVTRKQKPDNRKWVYFELTEQGREANELHRSYDRIESLRMIEFLLRTCTIEEIESFYKVAEGRISYFEKKASISKTEEQ